MSRSVVRRPLAFAVVITAVELVVVVWKLHVHSSVTVAVAVGATEGHRAMYRVSMRLLWLLMHVGKLFRRVLVGVSSLVATALLLRMRDSRLHHPITVEALLLLLHIERGLVSVLVVMGVVAVSPAAFFASTIATVIAGRRARVVLIVARLSAGRQ